MTMEQYSAEFMRLSRYAPYLIPDEEIKVEKFQGGLAPRILEQVIFVKVADFSEMVHVATMAEIWIKTTAAYYMSRKRPMSMRTSTTSPPKKQATSSSLGSQGRRNIQISQGSANNPQCSKCGRQHSGECRMGSNACFRCGKMGHFTRDCSQSDASRGQGSQASINQPKPTVPTWVYAITPENVLAEDNAANVVTGTIPLFGKVACALFDPGASHSFISSSYVKLCRVSTEPLEQNICVATPVGDTVTCKKYVGSCPIVIKG